MPTSIHEFLIYIHGVSQDNNQNHRKAYDLLHNGVKAARDFPAQAAWNQATRCNVEWGWNYDSDPAPEGNRLLAAAQDLFGDKILSKIEQANDWTINPARAFLPTFRELLIKGFSDMFYYTSRDGKSNVRATIAAQLMQCLHTSLEKDEPISLTFLGHSAGSVVAFDFLFYLFAPQAILNQHEFIEPQLQEVSTRTLQSFEQLRQLAEAGKLRVRRLITFGSPISMLAFRSNAVLQILAQGNQLNPEHYGLDQNLETFGTPLNGPRWLNFWDKDDIISWPTEPLMQPSPLVEDIYTDIGDRIATVHNEYWNSRVVHEKIAAYW